jgi:cell division protein FtsW (lipid II flippase)
MSDRKLPTPQNKLYHLVVIAHSILLAFLSVIAGSALSQSKNESQAIFASSFILDQAMVMLPALMFVLVVSSLIEIGSIKSNYVRELRSSVRRALQNDKSTLEYNKAESGAFLAIFLLALLIIFVILQIGMTSIDAFNVMLIGTVLLLFSFIAVRLVRATNYSLLRSTIYAIPIGLVLGYFA